MPSVLPTALSFKNYRSFAGPQRLELRPLTLLYGENNAGKSALVRSFPLLADSAASDGLDALDLRARLADLELDFDSLRWKGRSETDDVTVDLALEWEGDPVLQRAELAVWELPDWGRLLVQRLALVDGQGGVHELECALRRDDRRARTLRYRRALDDEASLSLRFAGLVPRTDSDHAEAPALEALARRLSSLADQVIWLRSLRPAPGRLLRQRGTMPWTLDPLGTLAPLLLHEERTLHREVSRWYETHLDQELIIERPIGRDLRIALRKTKQAAFDVDLVDAGEGSSQVLPVLTALAMAKERAHHGGPSIVAIEKPEAHLHPPLQHGLAAYACEVAACSGARVVLETHTRQFLLAVQHAILAGVIPAGDVIIYWVRQLEDGRSVARPVELDELARLRGDWPSDALGAELELAAEIQDLRAQKEAP